MHSSDKLSMPLVVGLFIFFCTWHLLTLNVSPLPWFDEVLFADVAINYDRTGDLLLKLDPTEDRDVIIYGPLYFILQQPFYKLFGITPFAFRLLNLIAGIIMAWQLSKRFKFNLLLLFTLLLSPVYIQNLHSGRMDLVASMFVLSGFLHLDKTYKNLTFKNVAIATAMFALAAITTPRALFLVPGAFIFLITTQDVIDFKKLKIVRGIKYTAFILLSVSAVLVAWSFYITGGLEYFQQYSGSDNLNQHMGISFLRNHPEDVLSIILLLGIIVDLIRLKKLSTAHAATICTFLSFAVFVKEIGPYAAMLIPFVLYGIMRIEFTVIRRIGLGLIAVAFAGIFLVKTLVIIAGYDSRKAKPIQAFLAENNVSQSKVLSSFIYYYVLKENDNDVKSYQIIQTNRESFIDSINAYDYDYLMIKESDTSEYVIHEINLDNKYIPIKSFTSEPHVDLSFVPFVGHKLNKLQGGYDGVLYKIGEGE